MASSAFLTPEVGFIMGTLVILSGLILDYLRERYNKIQEIHELKTSFLTAMDTIIQLDHKVSSLSARIGAIDDDY